MSTDIIIHPATAALVFEHPTEWVDRSLSTASWWDKYEIQVGMYAFEWVTIEGKPWNSNPDAHTPGFIANIGPYYGMVTVDTFLKESYRVNRLLTESNSVHETFDETRPMRMRRMTYAYQLPGCPKPMAGTPLTTFMGGVIKEVSDL